MICNDLIGVSLGHALKDLHFSLSQVILGEVVGEKLRNFRRHFLFPGVNRPYGFDKLSPQKVLQEVSPCSCLEGSNNLNVPRNCG